jgi:hypothetical protein
MECALFGTEDSMAGKRGLQQRLKAEIRKRHEKPRPQAVPTGNVRSDRWDEITTRHADLLEDIEYTLLICASENEKVDDAAIHVALVATMRGDPPDHPSPWAIFAELKRLRNEREEVAADVWLDALRVVDQSVRDHSGLRRGEASYLAFILLFFTPALHEGDPEYQVIEGRVSPPNEPS